MEQPGFFLAVLILPKLFGKTFEKPLYFCYRIVYDKDVETQDHLEEPLEGSAKDDHY
nr:MAG TPA: hypothetical protein [Herelleviridae sp.]